MLWFYLFIIFFVGLCFGSFLNALVWRTWQNIKIVHGRSMCPTCHRQLAWWENIPLFSFIMLGGRCLVCKNKISRQYPIVEFSMGVLFVMVAWLRGTAITFITPEVVRDWALVFNLAFIFLYDFNYGEILDSATIPTSLVLFAFSWSMGWPNIIFAMGLAYVLGAIFGVILVAMKKKDMKSEIPFGTYLTVATFIAMMWGDKIVGWY